MPLNTQFIDKDAVEEICQLDDDFYRNSWITFTYWKISERLAEKLGKDDATWFTFARWSSFTVGENLRVDRPTAAFEEFIGRNPILHLVRSPLVRLQLDMRSMSDSSMPRILAVGNRLVFHEIAYATLAFLDWYDDIGTPTPDEWAQYRKTIKATPESDLFQACDVNILRDGIEAYFLASTASSEGERARLVLRGNTLLAAYEQWRLEPVVRLSLDPVARNLVTFVGTNLHTDAEMPQAILRNRGTPWAFRHRSRINQWVTERYADLLTQHVLAWEGRFDGSQKNIFLGTGIPDPPSGEAHVVPVNVEPNDPITLIVRVFDRSGGKAGDRRALNWARFSDRMNFIVHLFRTEQHDRSLFEPPKDLTRRLIEVDLSDDHLDYLRTIGDRPVDVQVARLTSNKGQEPRDFVHELIANNFPADETLYGDKELPGWARNEKVLETGRHFFETNGLLIANALFFASLPYSYTAARGSQVLTRSAELTTGNTARRLAETGQMLRDLMHGHPGKCALTEGTRGFAAARGVRLFHAAVRHMILTDPVSNWDVDKLGMPVNQEDLLGTLVVFTVVVVRALETMGVDVTSKQGRKERDAYVYYWLVVGHLMGIEYGKLRHHPLDADEVPLNYDELQLVETAIFRRQAESSLAGQTLMSSLLQVTKDMMPWFLKGYPAAATRGFIGMERADALGVPPAGPARLAFEIVRITTRAFSPRVPGLGLAVFARHTTKRIYKRWIHEHGGQDPPWRT